MCGFYSIKVATRSSRWGQLAYSDFSGYSSSYRCTSSITVKYLGILYQFRGTDIDNASKRHQYEVPGCPAVETEIKLAKIDNNVINNLQMR